MSRASGFKLSTLALGFAFALTTVCAAHAGERRSVAQSVLKVEAIDGNGGVSSGSAVVIDARKVVTACHVTLAASRIRLLQADAMYEVSGQLADVEHDLCLLAVEGLDRPAVRVASAATLAAGENVFAVGYAFGGRARVVAGAIDRLHDYDAGKVIETSARFHPGDSGGGLFNERGELVGVLAFMLGNPGARHFAVPVDWLASAGAPQEAFRKVAPISQRKPFWVGALAALPYFLQAVAHDENQDWAALLEVADSWSHAEPTNAQARWTRAKALSALGRAAAVEPLPLVFNQ